MPIRRVDRKSAVRIDLDRRDGILGRSRGGDVAPKRGQPRIDLAVVVEDSDHGKLTRLHVYVDKMRFEREMNSVDRVFARRVEVELKQLVQVREERTSRDVTAWNSDVAGSVVCDESMSIILQRQAQCYISENVQVTDGEGG